MNDVRKNVAIIDYQLGNLFSVKQACDTLGINGVITSCVDDIVSADAIILPGVGAFMEAMKNLEKLGLVQSLKDIAATGKPIFGICLGLQLMFSESEEFGGGKGLELIPGLIKRFPSGIDGKKIKVPQIAWNTIHHANIAWENSPLRQVSPNEYMYFVHSYFVNPAENSFVLTNTVYEGLEYCSAVLKENIFGTQFHPEKSAAKGLSIYKNWASMNNLLSR